MCAVHSGEIVKMPRQRFSLKTSICNFFFVIRDADRGHNPSISVSLKGCEITPDIHIGSGKYGIKMSVPSTDGMSDLWVRCDNVRLIISNTISKALFHY